MRLGNLETFSTILKRRNLLELGGGGGNFGRNFIYLGLRRFTFEIHVGPSETGTRCIHATTASNVEAKGKRALLAVVFNANRFQQRSRSQWNISRDVRLIEKTDL